MRTCFLFLMAVSVGFAPALLQAGEDGSRSASVNGLMHNNYEKYGITGRAETNDISTLLDAIETRELSAVSILSFLLNLPKGVYTANTQMQQLQNSNAVVSTSAPVGNDILAESVTGFGIGTLALGAVARATLWSTPAGRAFTTAVLLLGGTTTGVASSLWLKKRSHELNEKVDSQMSSSERLFDKLTSGGIMFNYLNGCTFRFSADVPSFGHTIYELKYEIGKCHNEPRPIAGRILLPKSDNHELRVDYKDDLYEFSSKQKKFLTLK